MAVQISPLQLEGYYVREFHFLVRPSLEGQVPLTLQQGLHPQSPELFNPGDLSINIQAGAAPNPQEPNRLMALIEIESRTPPEIRFPYDFRVVLVGYFRLAIELPAEDQQRAMAALKNTAASVLYSAARELIAVATGRGPYAAAVLPTVVITLDEPPEQEQPTATKKVGSKKAARKRAKKGGGKKQQR